MCGEGIGTPQRPSKDDSF